MGPLTNFVNNLGLAILGGVGGWLVIQGVTTVGTLASFVSYSRQFGRPLNEIANLFNTIQGAIAGAERVFALIDEPPESQEAAVPLATVKGEVIFEEVSFAYTPAAPVLKGVSLHARPGQTIPLVGPTGAGKTTLINLLTRFGYVSRSEIGDGGSEVGAKRTDGCGLRSAIAADNCAIPLDHGRELFCVPDVTKVAQDRMAR